MEWEKIKPAPQPDEKEEWQLKLGGTANTVSLRKSAETGRWLACVCIVETIYLDGVDPPLGTAMLSIAKLLDGYGTALREGAWGVRP